jgi:hypothetical protein
LCPLRELAAEFPPCERVSSLRQSFRLMWAWFDSRSL